MKKKVELPIVEPMYNTYQYQGCGAAVIYENPSIRNWYLNESVDLVCTKRFLKGAGNPELEVAMSTLHENPYLCKYWIPLQFTKGYINAIIREMLNQEFYVYFDKFDDYYIEGKTWYKQRHLFHDGLICGYDHEKKTYCLYAYDKNWVCRKFETPQKALDKGREMAMKNGGNVRLCAIKPSSEHVLFNAKVALERMKEYLNSSLDKYPPSEDAPVHGIAVLDYMAMYIGKLQDGTISYKAMDWRVFRIIWEHKKVMYERLLKIEEHLSLSSESSREYEKLVKEADTMRMLFASHHMKRRDSVLPIIQRKLLNLRQREQEILTELVGMAGGEME